MLNAVFNKKKKCFELRTPDGDEVPGLIVMSLSDRTIKLYAFNSITGVIAKVELVVDWGGEIEE